MWKWTVCKTFEKDIQQEINRQNTGFDFNDEELASQIEQQTVKENEQTIEGLKNDLGNIFDTPISYQESTPVNKGGTIENCESSVDITALKSCQVAGKCCDSSIVTNSTKIF